jgi:hypothetical protein
MSERERFWVQVQGALDARRDPLELPEVQRALAEDPALLDELAALRSGLTLLARTRRRRVRSFAAAGALVAGVLGFAAWRAAQDEPRAHEPTVASDSIAAAVAPAQATEAADETPPVSPAGSRVIAFRAEVTVEGPRGRVTRTTGSEGSDGSEVRAIASASRPSDSGAPFDVRASVARTSFSPQPR